MHGDGLGLQRWIMKPLDFVSTPAVPAPPFKPSAALAAIAILEQTGVVTVEVPSILYWGPFQPKDR